MFRAWMDSRVPTLIADRANEQWHERRHENEDANGKLESKALLEILRRRCERRREVLILVDKEQREKEEDVEDEENEEDEEEHKEEKEKMIKKR